MGRPRSFDEDEVLGRALEVFWAQGYAATSIVDLEAAMGIKAGSIYKAFTDKRTLFMRSLDRYLAEGRQLTRETLDGGGSVAALRRWLELVAEMATAKPYRGCFAVNCSVELAPHDAEVRQCLGRHDQQVLRLFTDLVRKGQEAGELQRGDPALYARQLSVFISGLQVEGKKGLPRAEANRLVDLLLQTLTA